MTDCPASPTERPIVTVTLRARWSDDDPTSGSYMAAPRGTATVYRIASVHRLRTVGVPNSQRVRLVCVPVRRAEVPAGAVIHPWRRDHPPPAQRRQAITRPRPTADPGPAESPRARLARLRMKAPLLLDMAIAGIRKAKAAQDQAQLARAKRVGLDDGVRDGRDYGPGLRLSAARMRGGTMLRAADVMLVDGADPDRPDRTIRRARRADPLLDKRLKLDGRQIDAGELLRDQLELAETGSRGGLDVHLPGQRRTGVSDAMLDARTAVREAMDAVGTLNRVPVLWLVLGGTVAGCAAYNRAHPSTMTERLREGLRELADHFYGPVDRGRPLGQIVVGEFA
jgi:hypothetical protein